MKLKSLIALALLAPLPVMAAPFIVSDSYPGAPGEVTPEVVSPTHCSISYIEGWSPDVPVAIDSNGRAYCKIDVGSSDPGSHTVVVKAVVYDSIWGRLESAPSNPFTFVRPVSPAAGTGLRLVP